MLFLSFFSSNQVGGQHNLTESGSGNIQNREKHETLRADDRGADLNDWEYSGAVEALSTGSSTNGWQ